MSMNSRESAAIALDSERLYYNRQQERLGGNIWGIFSPDMFALALHEKEKDLERATEIASRLSMEELEKIAHGIYRGDIRANPDQFRESLAHDMTLPENMRKYKMIQQTGVQQSAASQPENPSTDLAFYQRIANPIEAVEKLGVWFQKSAMMGVGTKEAGIVVATTCLTERISPLEFQRRYHIIENRPSMRADYMLARFQELGGSIKIINRNAACSEVDLTWKGETTRFSFSWEDALLEPFVKDKRGAIKTNYATPRTRMQMLWARCVSDGVRTVCPQVNSGTYTPEEVIDMLDSNVDPSIIDAEYSVTEETPAAVATAPQEEAASHSVSPAPSGREPLRENGGVSAIMGENAAVAAAAQTGQSSGGAGASGMVTMEQLTAIATLKQALAITKEDWATILSNPKLGSVTTARALTYENADRLRNFLRKKVDALIPSSKLAESAQMKDEMSRWADGGLSPNASTNAKN